MNDRTRLFDLLNAIDACAKVGIGCIPAARELLNEKCTSTPWEVLALEACITGVTDDQNNEGCSLDDDDAQIIRNMVSMARESLDRQ